VKSGTWIAARTAADSGFTDETSLCAGVVLALTNVTMIAERRLDGDSVGQLRDNNSAGPRPSIAEPEGHRTDQSNPESGPLRRPPRLSLYSLVQIPIGLQPHPKLGRRLQQLRESKRSIRGNTSLPENDFVQPIEGDA
jgi:hypothetical protein